MSPSAAEAMKTGKTLIELATELERQALEDMERDFQRQLSEALLRAIATTIRRTLGLEGGSLGVIVGDEDATETLLGLARDGHGDDFRVLAGAYGVPPDKYDELWVGTRRRLGLAP